MARDCKLEYYRDKKGFYRWRIKAGNGEIIGASTQGYKSKESAQDNIVFLAALFSQLEDSL